MGVALALMARLALGRSCRQARNRRRMAPPRLSAVLDLEESPSNGPSTWYHPMSGWFGRCVRRVHSGAHREFTASSASWGSRWVRRPSPRTCGGIRGHHHKRGGCSSLITWARSWPPTVWSWTAEHPCW